MRERERFVGRLKREKERDIISECELISCFSFVVSYTGLFWKFLSCSFLVL